MQDRLSKIVKGSDWTYAIYWQVSTSKSGKSALILGGKGIAENPREPRRRKGVVGEKGREKRKRKREKGGPRRVRQEGGGYRESKRNKKEMEEREKRAFRGRTSKGEKKKKKEKRKKPGKRNLGRI